MSDLPHALSSASVGHFQDAAQQRDAIQFGVWLFLVTEVMLFGGPFTVYGVYRWMYPAAFAEASRHLNLWLGAINTLVLLGSSLTMALAHRAAEDEAASRRTLFLCLTLLLGSTFLGVKGLEYKHKFDERLTPGQNFAWQEAVDRSPHAPREDSGLPGQNLASQVAVDQPVRADEGKNAAELFFGLYFILTGVHALHMLAGIATLSLLVALSLRGRLSATLVSGVGLYWHFVDIVWIFLFPLLYLVGGLP